MSEDKSEQLKPDDVISGDISMSEPIKKPLYDQEDFKTPKWTEDDVKTALYFDIKAPGYVTAEWGIDYFQYTGCKTPEEYNDLVKELSPEIAPTDGKRHDQQEENPQK